MEHFSAPYYYYYCLCLCVILLTHVVVRNKNLAKKLRPRMPPGPWQLPLIGSLHHLVCTLPHHAMRDLSQRHGPLMLLRMGEHVAVVVSSADVAQDMFKGHETTFEQRPSTPGIDEVYSGNGALGVIFAPYGEHWRLLRRILVTELLSARRVEAFRHIRQDEAARLVSSIASSPPGQLVNVDELLAGFIADSSVRSIFGDRLPDRAAFLKMMKYGTDISSLFDLRDLFPSSWLVRLLPRSHKKEGHRLEVSRLIDDILQHHEERRAAGHGDSEQEQDMIDVLLSLQKEGSMNLSLTPGVINSLVMEIFGAALDTSTTTVQWAMAELIANPRCLMEMIRSGLCAA
ncbi:hypothetical protein QOZ80_9AG0684080 [Eleusine coracana subsp. coracana]|nr:hypothetical protein QOZ80_9AG0684080 [Eleusine coracana subsp. coracana]